MSTASRPQEIFSITSARVSEGGIALDQGITSGLVDHRGVIEMPAYGVLAESATSGAYWRTFAEPVGTVQSFLTLCAGVPARVGDLLCATGVMAYRDEDYGVPTVTVTNQARDVICSGVGRTVRVGRTTAALRELDPAAFSTSSAMPPPPPDVDNTVSDIPPRWDGRRILTALARGDIARGPLSELLAVTVTADEEPIVAVEPQPWMANPLGAIQGGVIAALIGQACSLAGQAHTAPGDTYMIADLSVYYFRSPPVDGRSLTMSTSTQRLGRRMATVSAVMADRGGTEYVHAMANIAYDRSGAF
ncbi:PaaI family thioesterase [Mycolicibacterium anyangense]|uniref:PaaI family thioesterase n=1 Tax=Mycolicibacterium anyangense TaxID=1431246 RepID=UPI0013D06587|nr:PaaI family thioesterase [Mycolicibacterium anyangense]